MNQEIIISTSKRTSLLSTATSSTWTCCTTGSPGTDPGAASARVDRFFVEGVGAGLAAETLDAVERFLAIPARALGREAQAGRYRGGADRSGDQRLDGRALVRTNFLVRFQGYPLTGNTSAAKHRQRPGRHVDDAEITSVEHYVHEKAQALRVNCMLPRFPGPVSVRRLPRRRNDRDRGCRGNNARAPGGVRCDGGPTAVRLREMIAVLPGVSAGRSIVQAGRVGYATAPPDGAQRCGSSVTNSAPGAVSRRVGTNCTPA